MRSWRAPLISGYILAAVLAGTSACSSGTSESVVTEPSQFAGTRTEHQIAVFECVMQSCEFSSRAVWWILSAW